MRAEYLADDVRSEVLVVKLYHWSCGRDVPFIEKDLVSYSVGWRWCTSGVGVEFLAGSRCVEVRTQEVDDLLHLVGERGAEVMVVSNELRGARRQGAGRAETHARVETFVGEKWGDACRRANCVIGGELGHR